MPTTASLIYSPIPAINQAILDALEAEENKK